MIKSADLAIELLFFRDWPAWKKLAFGSNWELLFFKKLAILITFSYKTDR